MHSYPRVNHRGPDLSSRQSLLQSDMASTRAGSTMDLDSQSFGVRDSDREDTNQDMNQTIIGAGLSFTKSQTSPAKGDKAKSAAAQPSPAYLFRSALLPSRFSPMHLTDP